MSPKTILAAFVVLTSMALNPVAANADWHRHTGIEFRFHHPEDYRHWHSGSGAHRPDSDDHRQGAVREVDRLVRGSETGGGDLTT